MDLSALGDIAQYGAVGIAIVVIVTNYLDRKNSRSSTKSLADLTAEFQRSAYTALSGNNEAIRSLTDRTGNIEKILERQTFIVENHAKHVEQALAQSAQTQENMRTTLEAFLLFVRKNGTHNT